MGKFITFILTAAVLFGLTVAFLSLVDALPDTSPPLPQSSTALEQGNTVPAGQGELPLRIVIKTIGMDETISNPTSTDVDVLDQALLSGPIHYPTSALLREEGTMLLFGHSSYLPIVHNQNYKAFDGIQNLKPGQTISVYSATTEYRYAVVGVSTADAASSPIVPLAQTGQHLTLITCDSFTGQTTDRYIVAADLEGTYALSPSLSRS